MQIKTPKVKMTKRDCKIAKGNFAVSLYSDYFIVVILSVFVFCHSERQPCLPPA